MAFLRWFGAALALIIAASMAHAQLDGLKIGNGQATTIVILHGDQSSGGDPGYLFGFGLEVARRLPNAMVHMLLRPGYCDEWGRQSLGDNFDRHDQYTLANAELILASLRKMKGESKLILVGHSGGAAQTALALSLDASLIDEAILVGCQCDLALWQELNPQWPADMFTRSVSALATFV